MKRFFLFVLVSIFFLNSCMPSKVGLSPPSSGKHRSGVESPRSDVYSEASAYARAVLLRERGDYAGALKILEKLLKKSPSPNYRVEYAWLEMKMGKSPKEVVRTLGKVNTKDLDVVHLKQLAEIYMQAGDISSAEGVLWDIYNETSDSGAADLLSHIEVKKLNIPYVIDFTRQLILTGDPFYFLPSFEMYSPVFSRERLEKIVELYYASGKKDSACAFILEILGRYEEALDVYGDKFPLDRDRLLLYLGRNLTDESAFSNLVEYSRKKEWSYFLSSMSVLYYNMAPYPTFHLLLANLTDGFETEPINLSLQEKLWAAHLRWIYGDWEGAVNMLDEDDPREGILRFSFLYNAYTGNRLNDSSGNFSRREELKRDLLEQGKKLLRGDLTFTGREEKSSKVVIGAIIAEVSNSNETARKWFEKAKKMKLRDAYPYFKLGDVFYELGDYPAAVRAYDLYIKLVSDDRSKASGYFSKALALYLMGEKGESVSALEESVKLDPENPTALNFLGYHLIESSNDTEAVEKGLEYVEKALEKYPDDYAFLDSAGWGYYRLYVLTGNKEYLEKSLDYFRKAYECMKKYGESDAVVLYHYGVVLLESGNKEQAKKALEQAKDLVERGEISEFDEPQKIKSGIENALKEIKASSD